MAATRTTTTTRRRRTKTPAAPNVVDARAFLDAMVVEDDFLNAVLAYLETQEWLACHTRDSRTVNKRGVGFPDIVAARNGRVVFIELKTMNGRVSAEQKIWHAAIDGRNAGGGLEMYVWRPCDWPTIERIMAA